MESNGKKPPIGDRRLGQAEKEKWTILDLNQSAQVLASNDLRPMTYPGGSNSVSLSDDPDLERLIDAWPELSSAMKAGILAMIDAVHRQGHSLGRSEGADGQRGSII